MLNKAKRLVHPDTIFNSPVLNLHTMDGQTETAELNPAGREDPLSFLGGGKCGRIKGKEVKRVT